MESRIRIKVGSLEIEYEGSEEFIREKLLALFTDVAELSKELAIAPDAEEQAGNVVAPPSGKGISLTATAIATRLGVKSGPDLAKAAAAYLAIVQGTPSFTRKQLLETMKTATGYYKETFRGNLTHSLGTLVKKMVFNETTKDTYTLRAEPRKTLEKQLAD